MTHFDPSFLKMIREHSDSDVGDGAEDSAIAIAESAAGFAFPPSYSEFLRHFNGGAISYIEIHGVGRSDAMDLITESQEMAQYIPEVEARKMFPFAHDSGGNYYCFDLTKRGRDGEYPVYLWNHEYADEPDDPELWEHQQSTFAEFIRLLYE